MKRMIHSLLAAAVLVSAMTCTVFAGDYTMDKTDDAAAYVGSVVTNDEGKSYTVSYDGATADNQYVVLVVKKEADGSYNAADEANILYINQAAAASNGTITFEGLIPMTNTNAVVLLGGVFAEGVDLPGDRLSGVAIVGVGLPQPDMEKELLAEAWNDSDEGRAYA